MTHKGTASFIAQRASAVFLLLLVGWLVFAIVKMAGAPLEEMRAFLALPVNAFLAALFIAASAIHMRIGMNEVIDDYAHGGLRGVWKLLNLFACLGAAALALWALFTLAV